MTNIYFNKSKQFQYYSREILSPIFKNPKCSFLYLITKNFGEIIGDKYKNFCKIEKVNLLNENRQGNIYLISFNSSVSFYINNNKPYIIEKINMIFGYDAVANIFVKEIPTLVKIETHKETISKERINNLKDITKDVKSSVLKDALLKLAESI